MLNRNDTEDFAAMGRFGRYVRMIAALCAALTLASCAQVVNGTGSRDVAPNADLKVIGDSGSQFDIEAKNALSDVMAFWAKEYPKVSGGKSLPPLKGGLFSVDGASVVRTGQISGPASKEACAQRKPEFIIDNAAFCLLDDSIIWDRDPQHLVPVLYQHYGALLVGLVFAHEFGHAIQYRLNVDPNNDVPTIDTESQADCAAGAWVASAFTGGAPHFKITPSDLDEALNGYLQVRDSTPESPQDISHGNGFDRISAIADGIEHGVTFCYSRDYFNRSFTERPFTSDSDYLTGGNEPISWIVDPQNVPKDLNRFWKQAAASIHKQWQDVKVAEAPHPKCQANSASEFGYCPGDNTVYYSSGFAKTAYYSLMDKSIDRQTANVKLVPDQPADFALGTLFVVAWGMAVRHQMFGRSLDDTAALRAASCYAGAYAKNVNVDPQAAPGDIVLSPPDMDEATSAMLNLVGQDKAFGSRNTTGLQRIQEFVKGYAGGLAVC